MKNEFFLLFSKGFPNAGLPNPLKDEQFRAELISALTEVESPQGNEQEGDKVKISESEVAQYVSLTNSKNVSEHTRNKAANWLIEAWSNGLIDKENKIIK